jgi:hypothetical protein
VDMDVLLLLWENDKQRPKEEQYTINTKFKRGRLLQKIAIIVFRGVYNIYREVKRTKH